MYDALVVSDWHLTSAVSETQAITGLLNLLLNETVKTKKLILNGDIFDSFNFSRLKKEEWNILNLIRRLSKRITVIWISGNHDGPVDVLSHLLGCEVVDEYLFEVEKNKILVIHGDKFDDFLDDHPVLTWIGDVIYGFLQRLDKSHSWARWAKHSSKIFLRCKEAVRDKAIKYALDKKVNIVICGHVHAAEHYLDNGVDYFNTGCWTEKPVTYLTVEGNIFKLENI